MKNPPARYLAWSLCVFSVGLGVFVVLVENVLVPSVGVYTLAERGAHVVAMTAVATVGAVVASRRPDYPIGWLLLSFVVISASAEALFDYYHYAVHVSPGALPGGAIAGLLANGLFIPAYGLLLFVVLLFPRGTLLSPRWRWAAWAIVVTHGAFIVAMFLSPEVDVAFPLVMKNPLPLLALEPSLTWLSP